jgi:hypothetical protein
MRETETFWVPSYLNHAERFVCLWAEATSGGFLSDVAGLSGVGEASVGNDGACICGTYESEQNDDRNPFP